MSSFLGKKIAKLPMPFLQCIEIEHCLSKCRWGLNKYLFFSYMMLENFELNILLFIDKKNNWNLDLKRLICVIFHLFH